MIIDTTQTKIERSMELANVLQELDSVCPNTQWFVNKHGFIFGHAWSAEIYISNKMDSPSDDSHRIKLGD